MIIYKTRYQAEKHKTQNDKVIKVDGGYAVMSPSQYRLWKLQK